MKTLQITACPGKASSEPAGEVTADAIEALFGGLISRQMSRDEAQVAAIADIRANIDRATAADRATIAELQDRLTTIADEAFGLQPVMPMDELLDVLERELFKLRQQHEADAARLRELEASEQYAVGMVDVLKRDVDGLTKERDAARTELETVKAERDQACKERGQALHDYEHMMAERNLTIDELATVRKIAGAALSHAQQSLKALSPSGHSGDEDGPNCYDDCEKCEADGAIAHIEHALGESGCQWTDGPWMASELATDHEQTAAADEEGGK